MARERRTLAAQAVSVARRALGRPAEEPTPEPAVTPPPAKKAPAKKAPAKKAPAKKAPAKKAPAEKAAAKKAPAKKAPAKKTAAKKTAAKKTAAQAPAKKTAAKKTAAKKTAAKKTAAKQRTTTTPTAPDKKAVTVTTSPAKKTAPKKTAKKAPAAEALVVKSDEEAWTPAELDEVMAELNEQREHSSGVVEEMEAELDGLMRDSGDGAGLDQADVGATTFERDHELSVLNSERDKLAQIDRALGRIADGSYGQCESCGQPIGKLRLMAFPRATLCMPCKQREERR
ncbi:TraR/DksA family transcriptional regulator [Nocardioides sp. SOB44]|uniref:TraR/DksA family transcriptional regulator n=1 Tax=Nocardioides cremeus TaxID=3058044 RepID=A0ABT8TUU4_9ACTN|nr:TraR/DksA family transcriptional regulator [Nocardioides cremeus]MDO3397732.1 TraR/DksA family transcriptional regulator [Nocardioides cremeus]